MKPAKRGDSIKSSTPAELLGRGPRPGVERSATPGSRREKSKSPRSGRQPFTKSKLPDLLYRTLRALGIFNDRRPGVSLRSTPGRGPQPSSSAGVRDFMLPPATRVLETPSRIDLIRGYFSVAAANDKF
jgi:hypothetical protein